MIRTLAALFAAGTALTLALAPGSEARGTVLASAQQETALPTGELIRSAIEGADDLSLDELWATAAQLADLIDPQLLDNEIEGYLAGASPQATLLLANLWLSVGEPDVHRLTEVLLPLIEGPEDIARGAAGLFSHPEFQRDRFRGSANEDRLLDALRDTASDGDRAVPVRLECAIALHGLGRGDDRRAANRQMEEVFRSQDPSLKKLGALALARSGREIYGPLRSELERLADLPTEEGRLASSYLKLEDLRELFENRLKKQEERLRTQYDGSTPGSDFGSPEHQFRAVRQMIEEWHLEGDKVDSERLLDAALDGMLRALDEHSSFMNSVEYAAFEQGLEAAYGGIGAYVGQDREDGLFTITRPIFTGPAYRAGLLSDDKVVRIDDWPTIGKDTEEIIKRLKGRPGTPLKLYIWRRGMDRELIDRPTEAMAVEVVREAITIPPVQSQLLPGGVGLLELRDFTRVAASELRNHILDLLEQGATSLVLDLRLNSGGLLDQAVEVAGLFLPKNTLIVSTESRVEATQHHRTRSEPAVPAEVPLAILIGRFSASASEIVAGALRDYDRATLIGQRSYGKGSVQNLVPLRGYADDQYRDENKNNRHDNWEPLTRDFNGNGEFDFAPRVKMTIARYLLPTSGSIHRELDEEGNILDPGGVDPDRFVAARRYDAWRVEEMWRLRDERVPRDYVDQRFEEHRELFFELADNDFRDPDRYPDLLELYESLDTPLPIEDVRMLVRGEVRRRVQDARGREFPPGDFVEDVQVQTAIAAVLEAQNRSPESIADYAATFERPDEVKNRIALVEDGRRREIADRLRAARRGEVELSSADLALLVELFDEDGQER